MDLIERQAAIDAMNSEGYTKNMRVHRKILSIPSVDAVPMLRGEWICLGRGLILNFRCSSCGNDVDCPTCMNDPIYRFCPYCGARMDGGER